MASSSGAGAVFRLLRALDERSMTEIKKAALEAGRLRAYDPRVVKIIGDAMGEAFQKEDPSLFALLVEANLLGEVRVADAVMFEFLRRLVRDVVDDKNQADSTASNILKVLLDFVPNWANTPGRRRVVEEIRAKLKLSRPATNENVQEEDSGSQLIHDQFYTWDDTDALLAQMLGIQTAAAAAKKTTEEAKQEVRVEEDFIMSPLEKVLSALSLVADILI